MGLTNKDIEEMLINEVKNHDITPNNVEIIKNANIENIINEEEKNHKNKFSFKKLSLWLSLSICLIIAFFSTIIVYGKEYESITIDVNPSVELNINRFNRVTSVNYNNDDAYNVFKDLKLKNKRIEDAIRLCYNKLYECNYLDNEENIVIVSGYNKNKNFDEDKLNKYSQIIVEESLKQNIKCDVKVNSVTKEQKEIANTNNISYGKLKIINLIILEDDQYTIDDLKDLSMKELKDLYQSIKKKGNLDK